MKRKYRETQKRVDEAILAAILSGRTSSAELKRVLVDGWAGYSVGELVDCFARTELSAAKQRLRLRGAIEITKGNEPKPAADLSPDDVEFIDARRSSSIAGQLVNLAKFNRAHGRPERAEEAERQLSLFRLEGEAVEEVAEEAWLD